jgi:GAF domain-containing protein
VATREELLSQTFVQLADTLVAEFDIVDLLSLLTERCVDLVEAAATGILLADQHGGLQVMAASSEQARLLELFQLQNNEGPCLDCHRSGRTVTHVDLHVDNPWPRFGPEALSAGFQGVHAFPMRLRENIIGALNLFMREPRPLSSADVAVAQALADAATIALLHDHAVREARVLTGQLQHALNSRIVIEQAKGVVAARASIGMDEAFSRLRSYARDHNLQLNAVARNVIDGELPVARLTRQARRPTSDESDSART